MNGIIIVNQSIGHNQYKIDRFKEECLKRQIGLDVFINDGSLAKIVNNNVVINLPKCDFMAGYEPVKDEKCPQCGGLLLKKTGRERKIVCCTDGCGYERKYVKKKSGEQK